MTGWGLCTYRIGAGVDTLGALRHDDRAVVAVPGAGEGGLIAALQRGDDLAGRLAGWDPEGLDAVPGAVLLAPLRYPRKLICAGVNYASHMAEMGAAPPGPDWKAWFFLKPPSTTVVGPGDAVRIDPDPAEQVDWEGELGIVIGRGGRDIAAADAGAHVAGFTVVNDVSARGPHRRDGAPHDAFRFDWLASKAQDTFCPMGPAVTPSWVLPDRVGPEVVLDRELYRRRPDVGTVCTLDAAPTGALPAAGGPAVLHGGDESPADPAGAAALAAALGARAVLVRPGHATVVAAADPAAALALAEEPGGAYGVDPARAQRLWEYRTFGDPEAEPIV